ncbi:MAG: helix-turn-helix domain-containing protein, partial [Devosiaceae bacterium]|nr:helix-turn-helix domain-containing protein [Devosiaceae bacterium]
MQNNQAENILDERYMVKPLFKAMQVLRIVCEFPQALTLREITELSEIPKSTVYRYLFTLTAMDMVDYNPNNETYSPGLGLWWLMQSADPFSKLRQVSSKERHSLMRKFNETVNLGVLTGSEVLYLEIVESAR